MNILITVPQTIILEIKEATDQKKLKILMVTPFFPPSIGGISNLVYNLCNALQKRGNEVHVLTSRSEHLDSPHEDIKITASQLTEIKSLYFPGWPYPTLRNFSIPLDLGTKVASIIRNGQFDIVHVHGHHYPICWIALRSAYKYRIPTVLSLHGTYALNPGVLGGKSTLEDIFNKYVFRHILSKSHVVVGGTKQIIDYARTYSSPFNKFRIIPNGVNILEYVSNLPRKKDYRSKYHIDQESVVILFVGRLDESKGALNFALAAKLLLERYSGQFEVVIVGKGPLEHEIRSCLKGLDKIKIIKWQPADKIHEIYIASDIFVLPSKFEGLPLSIMEAMNANLHIVFSNVGGVGDILQGYSKKSTLTNVTPQEICEIILDLYKDNSFDKDDEMSLRYAQTFDWFKIATSINLVYNEIRL